MQECLRHIVREIITKIGGIFICTFPLAQALASQILCHGKTNTNRFVSLDIPSLRSCWISDSVLIIALAPLEDIAPHILMYWKMRKTDVEILQLLKTVHINCETHGIGCNLLSILFFSSALILYFHWQDDILQGSSKTTRVALSKATRSYSGYYSGCNCGLAKMVSKGRRTGYDIHSFS